MKVKDLFTDPIVHLTPYASVDVSKFLHASEATGSHSWTFVGDGGEEWKTYQDGTFKDAARKAVNAYCQAYGTKFARLILTGMKPSGNSPDLQAPVYRG
jgi:hypothetical protein